MTDLRWRSVSWNMSASLAVIYFSGVPSQGLFPTILPINPNLFTFFFNVIPWHYLMNPYKYPSEQKLCPLWPIYAPILWNLVQRAKTAVWNYGSSKTSSGAMERTVPVFVKQEYWCLLHEVYQPCNLSCCTDCAKQLFFHTSILLSKWGISCCQPHSLRRVQMLEAISMENVCIDQFCLHNHCSIVHLKVKLHKYQSTSLERPGCHIEWRTFGYLNGRGHNKLVVKEEWVNSISYRMYKALKKLIGQNKSTGGRGHLNQKCISAVLTIVQ